MSGFAAEHAAVGALLAATFAGAHPACEIFGPNVEREPPALSDDTGAPASFLAWGLEYDAAERMTFGGSRRVDGRVVVDLCVEKRRGRHLVASYLDTLRTTFADVTSGSILFREPVPQQPGTTEGWYVQPVDVPFIHLAEP